jgi:hypothetical protein
MSQSFQVVALPAEPFAAPFSRTDAALNAIGAGRLMVDAKPGFPCRVSLRAYDAAAMMVGADVVHGTALEAAIGRLFVRDEVRYLHVHNAGPGCYDCPVVRV